MDGGQGKRSFSEVESINAASGNTDGVFDGNDGKKRRRRKTRGKGNQERRQRKRQRPEAINATAEVQPGGNGQAELHERACSPPEPMVVAINSNDGNIPTPGTTSEPINATGENNNGNKPPPRPPSEPINESAGLSPNNGSKPPPGITSEPTNTAMDDNVGTLDNSNNGLAPPILASGEPVTGASKERHRLENKRKRIRLQEEQEEVSYWANHQGQFSIPTPKHSPSKYRGSMCPSGLALDHPAADLLLQYALEGCPTNTGKPWTVEQMVAAIERGPHQSSLEPAAMEQLSKEVENKVKVGQAKVVLWDDIKDSPPEQLKISPIAMIPHKSRLFRAILDLSFRLRLEDGSKVPSVNEASVKTAPAAAIDQMGHALQRVIHAFAQADPDAKIFMAKWDIKDGFWRLDCQEGEEWNFAYVLPQPEGSPVKLVVPTSLQMGWIESPPFFCAASETGRDVAEQLIETPVGSLPDHKFIEHTIQGKDVATLPQTSSDKSLSYMVEVYVDDYISLAIPTSQQQLRHVANAVMSGVHSVFPADEDDENDPLSLKKLKKLEGMFALLKEILGFEFDGIEKTIWLAESKRDVLLTTLKGWIRAANKGRSGIPFDEFESVLSKLRHAFISIPNGKGLLSPCNRILRLKPKFIHLHANTKLLQAIQECRHLLRVSTVAPTKCIELVNGWPGFVGVKDSSGHGVGGVVVGELKPVTPTVFRFPWPEDIKADLVSDKNPKGRITNSDLEMAGLVMLFMVMEEVCSFESGDHVALFSDNQPTVHWVQRMASKSSDVAGQLLRALSLRMKISGVSPLTMLHIAGEQNAMTDIPSRSWGSNPAWLCETDDDLRNLFNKKFPLPNQQSWTVFRPSNAICTRVLSVLRMKDISMGEWLRLPSRGKLLGDIGAPLSNLWEWTLTFRTQVSKPESELQQDLLASSAQATMVEANKSKVAQSLGRSRPLARRSPWPQM